MRHILDTFADLGYLELYLMVLLLCLLFFGEHYHRRLLAGEGQ